MVALKGSVDEQPERFLRGQVTFAAGTTGAIAQHTVFTITGMVEFTFGAQIITDLTSGGAATISHGRVGSVAALGAVTTATTLDAGDFLNPANPTWIEASVWGYGSFWGEVNAFKTSSGTDITADILTATITGGVIEYYLFWKPISSGATVALGSELVAS